jgi:hypothetical protein
MFKRRLRLDATAAQAEAIVFSVLWSARLRPDVFEDPSAGGPDFQCKPANQSGFFVEVTSLDENAVSEASGLPVKITGSGGAAFSMITSKLESKASKKASQLRNRSMPCVLAITCSHDFASILMDSPAAYSLLAETEQTLSPLLDISGSRMPSTALSRSAFFSLDQSGRLIPRFQNISAVLLIAISGRQADIVGVLHPEPSKAFAPSLFPQVPFLRLNWPIVDASVKFEWSRSGEYPATFPHSRIQ